MSAILACLMMVSIAMADCIMTYMKYNADGHQAYEKPKYCYPYNEPVELKEGFQLEISSGDYYGYDSSSTRTAVCFITVDNKADTAKIQLTVDGREMSITSNKRVFENGMFGYEYRIGGLPPNGLVFLRFKALKPVTFRIYRIELPE